MKVFSFSTEVLVGNFFDNDDEIASCTIERARITFAANTQLHAVFNAGRYFYFYDFFLSF
jgi:hypothetical protein